MRCAPLTSRRHRRAAGLSLVETAIAVVLVGGLYGVTLHLVGASRGTQLRYADRERGLLMAEALLEEILTMPYAVPAGGSATLGVDGGEDSNDRATFDDAGDYHNYQEQPPADADGNPLPGAQRFKRKVRIDRVRPASPEQKESTDTGLLRISVTVEVGGRRVAELQGFRSAAWPTARGLAEARP